MENRHPKHPFEIIPSKSSLKPEFTPHKEGWIHFRPNGSFKHWMKKFVVLDEKKIRIFNNQRKSSFYAIFDFDQATFTIQVRNIENAWELILYPLGHKRHFHFKTYDIEDWAKCIFYHIKVSDGYKRDLVQGIPDYPFWKYIGISDHQFRTQAETGDIMLFQGKNIICRMQQIFTFNEYDHVAMVLKYYNGKIALLEATLENGVSIAFWDDFFKYNWFDLYEKISFRHLKVDRTESMLISLEEFLHKVIGKKYKITMKKLTNKIGKHKFIEEDGYFCSELVASAYRVMGLVPNNVSTSKYWPGDFSEKKTLDLVNAQLGPEQIIDDTA
ncbi:unnamed protein product [Blepharisma stoltei]|uniref:PH domain-containing protein n=1 Tax=Blepharisma stoltei TaxID=1481888 RepID=A0AAU9IRV9_9CILI|nr:unnamed protein product [Blepharisma stoltei]